MQLAEKVWWAIKAYDILPLATKHCGQSYKDSTIVNYDSGVVI